jgi:carbamoyl-phosphate synthase small subunit
LRFGYRGANNAVKDLPSGKASITSEKRGFGVDPKSLKSGDVEIMQINLNDRRLEGVRHKKHPVFSVQYHAEASPWPHDADCLFDGFRELILDSE